MLTVHHLGRSQSERIVWLCEELGLDYALHCYARDPATLLAPPEYKALHPLGAAPVFTDNDLVLGESGAIVDYILAKYGGDRLSRGPSLPDYSHYVYWFHFANGNLQSLMSRALWLHRLDLPVDNPVWVQTNERLHRALAFVDARLAKVDYFAGDFTAADIMTVFSLTTMRLFMPIKLSRYPSILAYLQRIGGRVGYQRAMAKGDPGITPMLT